MLANNSKIKYTKQDNKFNERKKAIYMDDENKTNRGGKRDGAGRPKGSTKEPTVTYYRRVKPEWVAVLDKVLNELKEQVK